jgi:hypothetical protein
MGFFTTVSKKQKLKKQLGMSYGTAANRLRKLILFQLVQETHRDICYQCKEKIASIDELSIEHMAAWLDSDMPKELFFDLDNIAFSHFKCNVAAGKRPHQKFFSKKERLTATNKRTREYKRRVYTTQKRREKYLRTGN